MSFAPETVCWCRPVVGIYCYGAVLLTDVHIYDSLIVELAIPAVTVHIERPLASRRLDYTTDPENILVVVLDASDMDINDTLGTLDNTDVTKIAILVVGLIMVLSLT